jgi:signal recognition particle subunit SRP72
MNKGDQVRELIQSLQQQFPEESDGDEGLTLITASLLLREKKNEEVQTLLQNYAKQHRESIRVPLSLAQIYLSRGDIPKVIATLEDMDDTFKNRPGIVAARVALYEKLGDINAAIRTLDDCIAWYESRKDRSEDMDEAYISILRASGEFKLKHKHYEQAAEMFERLLKKNRNDLHSLPQLVIAASHFDTALAEKYASRIPAVAGEDAVVDIDALENLPAPRFSGPARQQQAEVLDDAAANKKEKKTEDAKKKKKKKRLPKNFNPAVPPDPERWLPKWQRSYFKKRQKKTQLGKGSQGLALPSQSTQPLQAAQPTAKPAAAPQPQPQPQQQPQQPPQQPQQQSANKAKSQSKQNKKKKGRR